MLTRFCDELACLPQVVALADKLAATRAAVPYPHPLRIAPVPAAARAVLVAALARNLFAHPDSHVPTILFVVGTQEQAQRTSHDLAQWLDTERVLLYPSSATLSYEPVLPNRADVGKRLRTLQRLADCRSGGADTSGKGVVIVVPLAALLLPTLSPIELDEATLHLRIEDWLPQDTLIRRCLDLGYHTVPMVEEPGDLARRGGIVDLWPPTRTHPVRVEWFGDEIDSLRLFDPQTQRSERRLDTVRVDPTCDLPLWRHTDVLNMVSTLDTSTLRAEEREEWGTSLAHLEAGGRLEGWVRFAPFFFVDGARSILHHLPAGSVVVCSDQVRMEQDATTMCQQAEQQRATLIESGELLPTSPRPFLRWGEVFGATHRSNTESAHQETTQNDQESIPLVLVDMSNLEDANEDANETEPGVALLAPPTFAPAALFGGQLRRLVDDITGRLHQGERVVVVTPQAARLQEMVEEAIARHHANGTESPLVRFTAVHGALSDGWQLHDLRLTLYTDTEIFGWRSRHAAKQRQQRKKPVAENRAAFLRGLKTGEHVVHLEHGIARYEGLVRRTVGGVEREYLNLHYAAGERLYVPVDQIDRVSRYVGAGDSNPRLTRLGTPEWEQARRKVRAAVEDMAQELLNLYAARKLNTGHAYSPDNEWQHHIEESFPYVETGDQLRTLDDVKADMEATCPMDRLICGDVGFGKTEVALRAAFKAVQDNKQVAVLVPTTVLAQQHYETFRQRMAAFPVVVEMLSRFRLPREQSAILQRLAQGTVDILVGTHRLLSKDVVFKDLGLLVIDEEQRFGVRHKERLKQLRTEVDVLTLTATPIPRTLHMALAGVRDMSVIDTPPDYRLPIKTYVVPYTRKVVRSAIQRELERGGQVYFVHNRVQSIERVVERLRKLVPEARITIGHGQLEERQLEKVMFDFFNGAYDILVCTTIIESGLDIPNVNTIIIDDAINYGLAQLYQLRGRVGRSTRRAYAYLLYSAHQHMSPEAAQRLEAIQEATELGAGFRIAMRDLEIRGAGNMLGREQSGHIAAVGFDLYSRLLEQAVTQLKQGAATSTSNQQTGTPAAPITVDEALLVNPMIALTLPLSAYLPETYIADDEARLDTYQRMAAAQTPDGVVALRRDLRDRFGDPPPPADNLLIWLHIKTLALAAGVRSITTTDDELLVRPPETPVARERLVRRFGRDRSVSVGAQFVRLDRHLVGEGWQEKLVGVLEVLSDGDQVSST